jgi:hypothetical protein
VRNLLALVLLGTLISARARAETSSSWSGARASAEQPPAFEAKPPAFEARPAPPRKSPLVAARGSVGLGAGSDGIGARAAASVTAWPVSFLGATVEYQSAGDGQLFGPSEQFTLLSAGPSLRTWSGRLYFQVDTLIGFGHGYSQAGSADFFSATPRVPLHGPAFTLAAAAYWHPAFLELGPVVELTVYDGAALATLGFGLGVSL